MCVTSPSVCVRPFVYEVYDEWGIVWIELCFRVHLHVYVSACICESKSRQRADKQDA